MSLGRDLNQYNWCSKRKRQLEYRPTEGRPPEDRAKTGKQINREDNVSRDRPVHTWTANFQLRCKGNTVEKG